MPGYEQLHSNDKKSKTHDMAGHVIETDTVIIGAGYAGIAAAERLKEAGQGFAILEARDRIGSRTLTETLDCGPGFQKAFGLFFSVWFYLACSLWDFKFPQRMQRDQ